LHVSLFYFHFIYKFHDFFWKDFCITFSIIYYYEPLK
jgi:hypothetical protein